MINTVSLMVSYLRAYIGREEGQDLIEYATLGGLIALAITTVAVLVLQGAIDSMFTGIGNCADFNSATACDPF
ncbi:MAG TPA: Flp family type IVb pilin [Dehalococcoidia bacterium]